ncbi:hypothetical protein P8C59_008319 [Phyllachora maydis]|uniref:Uncharacterized protein n=1 Tax=Phyllachora maydis TaxID=1825666 RepID=A0AAD9IAW4_9PEZI|nr:hypothetical protein P8C59_008319 [Phyllachora maydis]
MRHSNLVLALFWAVASGLVLGTSRPDAGEVEPVSALSKRTPMFGGASSSGAGRSSTHQNEWIIRSFERYLPQGQQHMEAGQTYFFYTRVPWSSFLDYLRRDAPQPEAASAFLMSGFHYYVSQIEVSKKGSIAIKGEHERMGLNKRPPRGGIWEHKIYYAFKVATPPGRELDKYLLAQSKQFRDAWVQIKRQHNREGQNSMPELNW